MWLYKLKQFIFLCQTALLLFIIVISYGCCFVPNESNINVRSVRGGKTSEVKKSTISTIEVIEPGKRLSSPKTQHHEASTEATISADFSKLLKNRFQDLTSIRTGVAGCSLSNAAIAATWLDDLCVQELDYKLVARQFSLYLAESKDNLDENNQHLSTEEAWKILAELGDKLINKDETVLACVKDAGASFKADAVKAEYWKKLQDCINKVLGEALN